MGRFGQRGQGILGNLSMLRIDGSCVTHSCFQRWQRTWLSQICLACTSFSSCQIRSRWKWRSQVWCYPWIVKRGESSFDTEVWRVMVGAICWGLCDQPSSCTALSLSVGRKGGGMTFHVFLSQSLSLVQAPELDAEAAAFPVPPWWGSAASSKLHSKLWYGTDEHWTPTERFLGGDVGTKRTRLFLSPIPRLAFLI